MRFLTCFAAAFLLTLNASAADLVSQRAAFKKAYASIEAGKLSLASDKLNSLIHYPLYPYLRYAYLDRYLDVVPPQAVANFLVDYPGLPIDAQLRYRWLRSLAQNASWGAFLHYDDGSSATALVCARVSAALLGPDATKLTAAQRKDVVAKAERLWLSDSSQPKECNPAFDWLAAHDLLTQGMIRARFDKALRAHHLDLAAYLAAKLDDTAQQRVARWQQMASDPGAALANVDLDDNPWTRRLLTFGLQRLAHDNPIAAKTDWQTLKTRFSFDADDRGAIERAIALWEARQHLPNAYQDLAALSGRHILVKQWRIRTALWHGWWHTVLKGIYDLPARQRRSRQWQYWRARALAQTNHKQQADDIYRRIAQYAGYYGFLAADRLDLPYAISPQPGEPDQQRMHKLAQRPGIVRAHELFAVGMLNFADDEWQAATDNLSTADRCQAGLLAARWKWHAAAIRTLARGGCWDDIKLRYPLAYRDAVRTRANALGLDPAWLYGLMRSESLFAANAVSYAGALGLMQLMPSTGRTVASRLGIDIDDDDMLLDPKLNIKLGSAYLGRVRAHFGDNPCLATAAYNAGPGNVREWLPIAGPMAADVWVANIPFGQTRTYVRRVMAQTVVFDWRIDGKPERLSARMGEILPLANTPAAALITAAIPVGE
ncbi:MAG TPA: transglycosylase SLT domain-containing protein [Gammaproteobacteria bacterium]|nr:transglycosylase SLT domain-containing protein [Gammaproteobacteria bacterium]